jgi:6-phosphogluconolactonase
MRIRIFSDAGKLAEAAAAEIAAWIRLDGDRPTVGLAGGTTPLVTYELLRRVGVPWPNVHLWMTDERFVPIDHPDSNSGAVRRILADHVPAAFHEVPHIDGDPEASAAEYESELTSFLPWATGPSPGLVILGVGTDGHTASLFPGTDALGRQERGYVANWVPEQDAWRLTATIPLLTAARRTMFIVAGESKAPIVARILESDTNDPAAVVSSASRDAVWLLDRGAAARLARFY